VWKTQGKVTSSPGGVANPKNEKLRVNSKTNKEEGNQGNRFGEKKRKGGWKIGGGGSSEGTGKGLKISNK